MANLYGSPDIGKLPAAHPGSAKGTVILFNLAGGTTFASFLIQNWDYTASERAQEVTTLAETEHVYTFGRNLGRLTVSGYALNSETELVKNNFFSFSSKDIVENWEKGIRAKISGETQAPQALVTITPLGRTFHCIGTGMQVGSDVNRESLVQVGFTFIVLGGLDDVVTG